MLHPSAADILNELRQAIIDGACPAGTELRQDRLAERHGVDPALIRSALLQLDAEGLVRILPGIGAVVSSISREEIDDVFDLRVILEPRLLRRAIPALTAADFARIETIHHLFIGAVAASDMARWGALNAELHLAIYAHARLPRSLRIVTGLLQTCDRYTRLQLSTTPSPGRAEREHGMLIALCRRGEIDAACRVLTTHIDGVRADLHTALA
ncbi:MAG: GntR family transcriptional regulator [Tistrella sp.]|nr:GntR family transcriptional regulator [Tistrella sp.]MBA78411.1 GntR family transcriptional regulator [Tistrella sp.]